jgi:hypothetical protein
MEFPNNNIQLNFIDKLKKKDINEESINYIKIEKRSKEEGNSWSETNKQINK